MSKFRKAETNEIFSYTALTGVVNEIKSPLSFLKKKLFSTHEVKHTKAIEIGILTGDRKIAPFVKANAEAIMVDGHGEEFDVVKTPNIRIKRAFTPSESLVRRPGVSLMPSSASEIRAARNANVARDMARMADMVTNAEEWLCAQAIKGTISYSVADEEAFTITFAKPSGNTVALTTGWNDADSSLPTPEEDFYTAKKLMLDAHDVQPTDAIMGATAAAAFRKLLKKQNLAATNFVAMGALNYNGMFDRDGVLPIGMFCGVMCWEYSRAAALAGTSTKMIRDEYVEFVCAAPEAENVLYFGAIPDALADGDLFVGERFSKSWEIPDPSARIALLASCPLPVMRRPGSVVSMDVIV